MSAKTSADVLIGGKIYTLSGYESEAYLQKVAAYINNKINEFDEMEQFRRFPADMKSTLLELNIADDYFKAKDQAEKLEQDIEAKDKEIYDLKHDLISAQIKIESNEKSLEELERENKELLLHKAKLEASLEDALLGKVKGQAAPEVKTASEKDAQSKTAQNKTASNNTVSNKTGQNSTVSNKTGQNKTGQNKTAQEV